MLHSVRRLRRRTRSTLERPPRTPRAPGPPAGRADQNEREMMLSFPPAPTGRFPDQRRSLCGFDRLEGGSAATCEHGSVARSCVGQAIRTHQVNIAQLHFVQAGLQQRLASSTPTALRDQAFLLAGKRGLFQRVTRPASICSCSAESDRARGSATAGRRASDRPVSRPRGRAAAATRANTATTRVVPDTCVLRVGVGGVEDRAVGVVDTDVHCAPHFGVRGMPHRFSSSQRPSSVLMKEVPCVLATSPALSATHAVGQHGQRVDGVDLTESSLFERARPASTMGSTEAHGGGGRRGLRRFSCSARRLCLGTSGLSRIERCRIMGSMPGGRVVRHDPQVCGHLGGMALGRWPGPGQQRHHGIAQRRAQLRPQLCQPWRRRVPATARSSSPRLFCLRGLAPGEQLEQGCAQAVHIACRAHRAAGQLLWRCSRAT